MRVLALAMVAALLAAPALAAAAPSALDALLAHVRSHHGGALPAAATMNGHRVAVADALALLAPLLGPARVQDVLLPSQDVGLGVLPQAAPPGVPCRLAGLIVGANFVPDGGRAPLQDVRSTVKVPLPAMCGGLAPVWAGDVSASVAEGDDLTAACVAGSWLALQQPCYVGGFAAGSLSGARVGYADITLDVYGGHYHIQALYGGVEDAPGRPLPQDFVVGTLQ